MTSIQVKLTVTKAFNTLFMKFMDNVIEYIPETHSMKQEVKKARQYFDLLRSMNPSLIIKIWYSHIYTPYQNEFQSNDIFQFILKKNYETDLSALGNAKEIIEIVDNLKEPIGKMSVEQREIIMDHLRNLSSLSCRYMDL